MSRTDAICNQNLITQLAVRDMRRQTLCPVEDVHIAQNNLLVCGSDFKVCAHVCVDVWSPQEVAIAILQ
jgi:hypothetical protein